MASVARALLLRSSNGTIEADGSAALGRRQRSKPLLSPFLSKTNRSSSTRSLQWGRSGGIRQHGSWSWVCENHVRRAPFAAGVRVLQLRLQRSDGQMGVGCSMTNSLISFPVLHVAFHLNKLVVDWSSTLKCPPPHVLERSSSLLISLTPQRYASDPIVPS